MKNMIFKRGTKQIIFDDFVTCFTKLNINIPESATVKNINMFNAFTQEPTTTFIAIMI